MAGFEISDERIFDLHLWLEKRDMPITDYQFFGNVLVFLLFMFLKLLRIMKIKQVVLMISYDATKNNSKLTSFFSCELHGSLFGGEKDSSDNFGGVINAGSSSDLLCDNTSSDCCQRLLSLLSDGFWHSVREINKIGGHQYNARIYQLRHGLFNGNKYVIINRKIDRKNTEFKLQNAECEKNV